MSLEKRVTQLEEEVRLLRAQVESMQRVQAPPAIEKRQKPPLLEQMKEAIVPPVKETTSKPKRSMEELLAAWLPKVFMVILLLGVVWGLKVMSDYGLFGDTLKIASAYVLSIVMLGVAYWKRSAWRDAAVDSLFGGAFIVGILATAAGAILYSVLSESVALIIALIYIVYGVAVSYVRRNEALTSFVFFTSLLLPYLLDYMDMSKSVIFMYIVVMFSVMQVVIVKYAQWYAQLIGFVASVFTLTFFLWQGDAKVSWALLIVLLVMAAASVQLFTVSVPRRFVRIVLFSSYATALGMFIMEDQLLPAVVSTVMLVASTVYVMKQQMKQAADVLYPLSIVSFVVMSVIMTDDERILLFVLPAVIIGAMAYAAYHRFKLATVVLTMMSVVISFVVYVTFSYDVEAVVYHMQYVLLLIYAAVCYGVLRRHPVHYERNGISIHASHYVWLSVLILWIGYSVALNDFFAIGDFGYVAYYMMTALLVVVLALTKWFDRFAEYSVIVVWTLFSLSFLSSVFIDKYTTLHVVTQLSVLAVLGVMLLLILRFNRWATIALSVRVIAVIAYMYVMYVALINQLFMMEVMSSSVRMMLHTLMLFGVAAALMAMHQRYAERIFMRLGIVLLVIAFMKLLLVDLVAINIFVRAILFIVIGTVGFYLSTRLRGKASDT